MLDWEIQPTGICSSSSIQTTMYPSSLPIHLTLHFDWLPRVVDAVEQDKQTNYAPCVCVPSHVYNRELSLTNRLSLIDVTCCCAKGAASTWSLLAWWGAAGPSPNSPSWWRSSRPARFFSGRSGRPGGRRRTTTATNLWVNRRPHAQLKGEVSYGSTLSIYLFTINNPKYFCN